MKVQKLIDTVCPFAGISFVNQNGAFKNPANCLPGKR
jgi:hypothetical protein